MRIWLATACVFILLSGCTAAPNPDDPSESSWWQRSGIQCEPMPWVEWAEAEGRSSEPTATEPFQRDTRIEELVHDYYVSEGLDAEDTRAYFDDLHRTQVCGNDNGWHYWLLIPDGTSPPDDGWTRTQSEPAA